MRGRAGEAAGGQCDPSFSPEALAGHALLPVELARAHSRKASSATSLAKWAS